MENKMKQKKLAIINDFSGFGRCSLTVALPIISVMKVQACPVPTSIFSNHTAYPSFFFDDYTSRMQPYIDEWKKLGLSFDGILSGFLGSVEQIQIVTRFFRDFKGPETTIIVDPIMGDDGSLYRTYTRQMCVEMRRLIAYADIITPNLTEACFLTETPYHAGPQHMKELAALAEKLSAMGPEKVVITGICQGDSIANYCYERGKEPRIRRSHKVGTTRCGTGDVFSSIIAADAVNKVEFSSSVKKASSFVKRCIEKSVELDIPREDGVCFEEFLKRL